MMDLEVAYILLEEDARKREHARWLEPGPVPTQVRVNTQWISGVLQPMEGQRGNPEPTGEAKLSGQKAR